jgi:outer membrane protein OmpA-like peptidoglycan-associated protein
MLRTGKCPNYAGCLLAYRGEIVTVEDGHPFVCPDCGKVLMDVDDPMRKPVPIQGLILGGLSILVIMGSAAVWYRAANFKRVAPGDQLGSSFEQAELAASRGELLPSRHLRSSTAPTPIPDDPNAPIGVYGYHAPIVPVPPPTSGVTSEVPSLDPHNPQTQQVRSAVLAQLAKTNDPATQYSAAIERATRMGHIVTIPFPPGHVALSPNDIVPLRTALAAPSLQPLLSDPNLTILVLGFADIRGNSKTNAHISYQRAQAVADALPGLGLIPHSVCALGMGASTLYGNANDDARSQSVEIWVLLP